MLAQQSVPGGSKVRIVTPESSDEDEREDNMEHDEFGADDDGNKSSAETDENDDMAVGDDNDVAVEDDVEEMASAGEINAIGQRLDAIDKNQKKLQQLVVKVFGELSAKLDRCIDQQDQTNALFGAADSFEDGWSRWPLETYTRIYKN